MSRIAVIATAALTLIACGGERTFEAQELVDELNDQGAALTLGESLAGGQEEMDLFAVSVPGGVGTLAVAGDADGAIAEYRRCEGAVSLTCYRAANAVLYFEATPDEPEVAKVDAAIRALASD